MYYNTICTNNILIQLSCKKNITFILLTSIQNIEGDGKIGLFPKNKNSFEFIHPPTPRLGDEIVCFPKKWICFHLETWSTKTIRVQCVRQNKCLACWSFFSGTGPQQMTPIEPSLSHWRSITSPTMSHKWKYQILINRIHKYIKWKKTKIKRQNFHLLLSYLFIKIHFQQSSSFPSSFKKSTGLGDATCWVC